VVMASSGAEREGISQRERQWITINAPDGGGASQLSGAGPDVQRQSGPRPSVAGCRGLALPASSAACAARMSYASAELHDRGTVAACGAAWPGTA
jgi:hypothetical protein